MRNTTGLLALGLILLAIGCENKEPVVNKKEADEAINRVTATEAKKVEETTAWVTAKDADSIKAYEDFIEKYPQSEHVNLARSNLDRKKQLLAAEESKKVTELQKLAAEKKAAEAETNRLKQMEETRLANEKAQKEKDALKAENARLEDIKKNPGGIIRVFCEAGYVASFSATWNERQPNGSYVPKSWNSGRLSTGKRSQVEIPPRSRDVKLRAEGDVVNEIFNITPEFGKEYKVYGTIFKSGWAAQ